MIAFFLSALVFWSAMPGARLTLDASAPTVTPDGAARVLVRVLFTDQHGRPTTPLKGGDVAFSASRGTVQWQTRLRFSAPAAVVSTTDEGPLTVDVRTDKEIGSYTARVTVDVSAVACESASRNRRRKAPLVAGAALGPHLVRLGWFPRALKTAKTAKTITITRQDTDGSRVVGVVDPTASRYDDLTVKPGARYRYTVTRVGYAPQVVEVRVPAELPTTSIAAVRGKGMWLTFSPDPRDDDAYTKLEPRSLIEKAKSAGLHFIELRTAYGPYWEVTPQARALVNALIDQGAEHGVGIIGWTVPRSGAFDDLALNAVTAAYTTPRGNHFAGLAIDLERGDAFMGSGAIGYAALVDYPRLLRAALGPRYPLIATIEDPFIEHLTNKEYPYAAIAANVDVLQPMVYWSALSPHPMTPAAVRVALVRSYAAVLGASRRHLPISIGGQTTPLDARGGPGPAEIRASLKAARALGALGEAFFSWQGTNDAQWEAITRP